MSQFSDYTAAINARLTAIKSANPPVVDQEGFNLTAALAGVTILVEDTQELETQIDKAMAEVGMLILIGMPTMENTRQAISAADMIVHSAVAVGESPTVWRDAPGAPPSNPPKPVCLDVVQAVVKGLQGLPVTGFRRLRVLRADFVPSKTRQLYEIPIESQTVVQAAL
jgi:hypothetical protein